MKNYNKIHNLRSLILGAAIIGPIAGCGPKGDDNAKSNSASPESDLPYGKLVLSSNNLPRASLLADTDPENCTMYGDQITPTNGSCMTPLTMGGFAVSLHFGSKELDPHLRGGTRMFSADERTVKPGQIFSGGIFDISSPTKSLVGNNTLAGPTSDKTPSHRTEPHMVWSNAQINMLYLKYQVLLNGSYVTILLPSYAQPYADDTSLSQCESKPSAEVLSQSRYTETTLLADMTFRNGDYLFCVKDSADVACESTDFKWLDLDTMTLVTSRPTNPRQSVALKGTPSCTAVNGPRLQGSGGGGFELGYGNINLMAKFKAGQTFKLYGEFTHGPLSEQWKDATAAFGKDQDVKYENKGPWVYYSYIPTTGATQNGGNLSVELDFDVSGMVFLAMTSDDLASATLEEKLKVIDTRSTWINDQIAANNLNSAGLLENLPIMEVTPTVSVTGGEDIPTSFEDLFTTSGQTDTNPEQ